MYKSFVVELKIFSGTTVLPIKGVMHGGPNIKLGLHVPDMSETDVNTLGLEKWFGKKVVSVECGSPEMGEIGTSFQNYPPWNLGGLGWGSQNVEAPNPKLPTKWFLNVFHQKNI